LPDKLHYDDNPTAIKKHISYFFSCA